MWHVGEFIFHIQMALANNMLGLILFHFKVHFKENSQLHYDSLVEIKVCDINVIKDYRLWVKQEQFVCVRVYLSAFISIRISLVLNSKIANTTASGPIYSYSCLAF